MEITKISNNFFIEKIQKIRDSFTKTLVNPIDILNYLIPRNKNEFTLSLITIKETQNIIK